MQYIVYIDRDAATDELAAAQVQADAKNETLSMTYEQIIRWLRQRPVADAAPVRHGRWRPLSHSRPIWECSRCQSAFGDFVNPTFLYCPRCGAKLDKDKEETKC